MKSRKLLALFLAIFMLASLMIPVTAITPEPENTVTPTVGYSAANVVKVDLSQVPQMVNFDANSGNKTYQIKDATDWDAFDVAIASTADEKGRGLSGYTIYLANDLDFDGAERTPLGTKAAGFAGTFDGQGYAIKNLKVVIYNDEYTNNAKYTFFGLFGCNSSSFRLY